MMETGMRIIRRGEPEYEKAIGAATWTSRDYGYSDVIVKQAFQAG